MLGREWEDHEVFGAEKEKKEKGRRKKQKREEIGTYQNRLLGSDRTCV